MCNASAVVPVLEECAASLQEAGALLHAPTSW